MKKLLRVIVLISLWLMYITGCKSKEINDSELNAKKSRISVSVYEVTSSSIDEYLEFGGDVCATSSVAVTSDLGGTITNVFVRLGQKVKKGEIIASVDPSSGSDSYLLNYIDASVSGTITYIPVVAGTKIVQNSVIAKISDTSKLEIEIAVPEKFISKIKMNQKAEISYECYDDLLFSAAVSEISPVLNISSRTMPVKLSIVEPTEKIKIGMFGKVRLITNHVENTFVIPEESVVSRSGKNYVYIVSGTEDSENASLVPVELGVKVENRQEIIYGIIQGDKVVVKGQTLLSDGSPVKVVTEKPDCQPEGGKNDIVR